VRHSRCGTAGGAVPQLMRATSGAVPQLMQAARGAGPHVVRGLSWCRPRVVPDRTWFPLDARWLPNPGLVDLVQGGQRAPSGNYVARPAREGAGSALGARGRAREEAQKLAEEQGCQRRPNLGSGSLSVICGAAGSHGRGHPSTPMCPRHRLLLQVCPGSACLNGPSPARPGREASRKVGQNPNPAPRRVWRVWAGVGRVWVSAER